MHKPVNAGPADSTQGQLRSTGSGAFGDLPPGEPLEAEAASPPMSQVASQGKSPGMVTADRPQGISMQLIGQQPPQLSIPSETTQVNTIFEWATTMQEIPHKGGHQSPGRST